MTGALISPTDIEDVRARTSLVSMVAKRVKLRRAGRDWSGLCPFHQEKTASFTVSDEKGFYHCFGCGAHGDCYRWLQETEGLSFPDAYAQLAGGRVAATGREIEQRKVDRPERHDFVGSETFGRWVWQTAGPARGEIVEAWLRSRGLDPEGVPGALDRLRFHPRCPVTPWRAWQEPGSCWLSTPAMVAPIADEAGAVWGVHVTWLAPDGRAKARLPRARDGKERPSRKMLGRVQGRGVWLTEPRGDGPLVVGEGLETSWAYAERHRREKGPCRVAAALSLDNLQGSQKRLRDGTRPLWRIEAELERACFTIPSPGEVIVLVDADMQPLREQKVQTARGAAPVRADITPLQRAEICAQLSAQQWRNAGATRVTAVRPRMGMDFNDVAMEAAA